MKTKILKTFLTASTLISAVYSMEVEESIFMDVEKPLVTVENVSHKRSRTQYETDRTPRKSQRLVELAQRNYKFTINNLPNELIHDIFAYLDIVDSLNARVANVRFLRCSLRSWKGELREYDTRWVLFYPRLTELTGPFAEFSKWDKGFRNWLSTNNSLTSMDISNSKIDPSGIKIIISALTDNSILTRLNLGGNIIGNTGTKIIADFLKKNTTLKTLSLINSEIKTKSALQNITKALSMNTTLTELYLGDNALYCKDIGIFFESIKRNTSLKILELDQTGFDYDLNGTQGRGGTYIAEILEQNTTLTSLSVRNNDMAGEENSRIIAQALEKNSTLKELFLGGNNLGTQNIGEILEALKKNTSLTVLDLQWNCIFDVDSKMITEMLKMNTTLKELYLDYNYITDIGAQVIAETLGENTNLKELYLDHNEITPELQVILKEQWGDRIYV